MQNLIAAISLKRIRQNAESVARLARKPLVAVVKDDAYGHGAEEVARALHGAVSAFAVATVDEGAALKVAGIEEDILVLTPALDAVEALRLAEYGLVASASSLAALNLLVRARKTFGSEVRAHLCVNTGMNRYGLRPELVSHACRVALENGLKIEGVYSHYYQPENERARGEQRRIFEKAAETVREFFPGAVRHIAATGGVLAGGELFDAVRAGIALYGYLPAGFEGKIPVLPAMKIYATVAQSGTFTGGGVGYGVAEKKYGKLHTLRLGYGDGFFRAGGTGVGKLCMDACVREGRGDFGRRKTVLEDVRDYAALHSTTPYEVLVNFGKKAVKIYD